MVWSGRTAVFFALFAVLGLSACSLGLKNYGEVIAPTPGADPTPRVELPANAPSISQHFRRFSDEQNRPQGMQDHMGIDIVAPKGTPVLAAMDGVVVTSHFHPLFGNEVILEHPPLPDGRKLRSVYKHMASRNVEVGSVVERGDVIGGLGRSGAVSSGILHLHFEVQAGEGYKAEVLDPNRYWIGGQGRVTCFTQQGNFPKTGLRLTYPVQCR